MDILRQEINELIKSRDCVRTLHNIVVSALLTAPSTNIELVKQAFRCAAPVWNALPAVTSPGFGARRGTKLTENNLRATH